MDRVLPFVLGAALAIGVSGSAPAQSPQPAQNPLQFPQTNPVPPAAQPAQPPQTAQKPPPAKRVKLRTLLEQGYEIKTSVLVPQDVGSRIVRNLESDGIILTLQKGAQIATCWYSISSYTVGDVLDSEWCQPHL
ncbi:MAG: hypothetical protein ACT4N2_00350 [Hyphomicrobium sp.]